MRDTMSRARPAGPRSAGNVTRFRAIRPAGHRRIATIASGAIFLLGGCSAEQRDEWSRLALPEPATEEAPLVGDLWIGAWIAAFAVGFLVWGLILWAVIVYRKRNDQLPKQTRFNIPIEFLYTVAPFFVIAPLFYFTADHQGQITDIHTEPDLTVDVVAQQWSWTFNYVDEGVHEIGTINERPTLYLPVGQTVRFNLESPDVIHSFWIPAFYIKQDAFPGQPNALQLTPDREGSFEGRCAEFCGVSHQSMRFSVEVVSEREFDEQLDAWRESGQTGRIDPPIRGAYADEPLNPDDPGGDQ